MDTTTTHVPNISGHGDVISAERVQGTDVYGSTRERLGSIDGLMIDKRSGQVRYAVLEFGGFLGLGANRYPLPWQMLKYDTALDGYLVPLTRDMLDEAPRHDVDDAPDYTADYGRRVSSYYGVDF